MNFGLMKSIRWISDTGFEKRKQKLKNFLLAVQSICLIDGTCYHIIIANFQITADPASYQTYCHTILDQGTVPQFLTVLWLRALL